MEISAHSLIKNIILCIDGEPWTEKAVAYAIEVTRAVQGNLTALHVINTYLNKFADELYAVGRTEYRNHIDRELRMESDHVITAFKARTAAEGITCPVIVRYGLPEDEIIRETSCNAYDLVILGGKPLTNLKERIGSFNLPLKVFKKIRTPVMFVR